MIKFLTFLFLCLFVYDTIFATVIEGQNQEYAGKKLNFYQYSDPVTLNEELMFSLTFDNQGKFKSNVPVSKTTYVFCDYGIYRGMLFLEPEKTIKILLPPFREKSFADQKNPFFKPVPFWFTTGESGLNKEISDFDEKYYQLTNQYFNQLYFLKSNVVYDSVTNILNGFFSGNLPETFLIHKKLKLKLLETDVFRLDAEKVSDILPSISSDYWTQPAFIEFFEKVFTSKLSFDSQGSGGAGIKKAVDGANIQFLLDHLKSKYKLKGEITELALLKMLHDGFYSGEFSQNSILKLLQSEKLAQNPSLKIREITKNVTAKLKHLLPGSAAPVICLKDIDGNKKCSGESTDKFKYIVFADAEMIVCREQLKYLTKIDQKFQKNLELIVVMRKTDLIEMKIFLLENMVPGIKLIDESGEFIEKYNVKSFPACYLLDEKHRVVFSGTKAPLDGFEQQFGTFLQRELFERQRNQVK